MELIKYLLIKKKNIPFFEVYKFDYLRNIILIFSIFLFIDLFLINDFCLGFFIVLEFFFIFSYLILIFKVKTENNKIEKELIKRYHDNESFTIDEFNYIYKYLLKYNIKLIGNNLNIKNVIKQILILMGGEIED